MTRTLLICGAVAGLTLSSGLAAQQPTAPQGGGLEILPAAGNVYLFAGSGANVVGPTPDNTRR